jgi:hypothetical protein
MHDVSLVFLHPSAVKYLFPLHELLLKLLIFTNQPSLKIQWEVSSVVISAFVLLTSLVSSRLFFPVLHGTYQIMLRGERLSQSLMINKHNYQPSPY